MNRDVIYTPPNPQGVILALHGLTRTPAILQRDSGLDAVGAATQSIVHYVDAGLGRTWNWIGKWPNSDVNKLTKLLERYSQYPIAIFGHSAGGCMAARMLAVWPEQFCCGVIYSGWLLERVRPLPGEGMPLLVIRGTKDRTPKPQRTWDTADTFEKSGFNVKRLQPVAPHRWSTDTHRETIALVRWAQQTARAA